MTPKTILKIVCSHFGTTYEYEKLHSEDRHNIHLVTRYYCFIFLKENTLLSLSQIGMLFDQDHATVLNGIKKLNYWMDTDVTKKKTYDKLSLIIAKYSDNKIKTKSSLEVRMVRRRLKNPMLNCV